MHRNFSLIGAITLIPFFLFQPCYQAAPPKGRLLQGTPTLTDVVHALNNFYDEFLGQCIKVNLDHANQQDINDGQFNKENATKVLPFYIVKLPLLHLGFMSSR